MKAMLEQHATRLTRAEKEAVWQQVDLVAGARARRTWRAPAMAAGLAAAAALAFVLSTPRPALTPLPSPIPRREQPVAIAPPAVVDRQAPPMPAVRAVPERRVEASESARRAAITATQRLAPPAPTPVRPVPSVVPSGGSGVITGRLVDDQQKPMAFASIHVLGTRRGAQTDADGRFTVRDVPLGAHQLRAMALGHDALTREVRVTAGSPTVVELNAGSAKAVRQIETIQVSAEKRIDTKASTTQQSISAERLREIPVGSLSRAIGARSDAAQSHDLQYRGGRAGEVKFEVDGQRVASPPVIPITGGSALPNDEPFDAMFFQHHGVNPFIATDEDALSTFAVDVDAASYTVTRRYLELGHLPPADAVRVEEFVNFFEQGYPRFEQEDFRILLDGAPSAFGAGLHLLRVGIKGREILAQDRAPAHLTFVIDISGSMAREDRLELVKRALALLVDELRPDDRVGIVVYGNEGRVLLEPTALGRAGAGRARILEAIAQLHPDGSTNAEEGIRLGYDMARRDQTPGHIHRILLCSDGVANVGRTGPESILKQVRSEADRGVALTTIGFGMGNYNDKLMEQLADQGDGNHYYVDDIVEAERVLVENLTGTLQTIAKDAKVQVEFDSTRVLRYRLIGFENRDVADRDFRNDRVDAGEIGAGHEVTALYEVKLAPRVTSGTLATVRLRYADPESRDGDAPRVTEIARSVDVRDLHSRFEQASPHLRRDAAVAEFAEVLRGSYWARESQLASVLTVARGAARDLRDEPSRELVRLLEKAASLKSAAGAKVREQ